MRKLIGRKDLRKLRSARLAAAAVVVVAAVAGAAGTIAGPGNAAPGFKSPKLKHGLLTIKGTEAGEKITLRLRAGQPGILQVDVGDDGLPDFEFERADIAEIAVDARAGDDLVRIDESAGIFTTSIPTTIDGGEGDDTLAGGSGAETLQGGGGDDRIDGNRGNDVAFLGGGVDIFVSDPGDGSDTVEGQGGVDTLLFNGANIAEKVELSANGKRLRFFRDVAGITMDTDGVEKIDFNALGGADLVTVNDLRGTDVTDVNVDLAGATGGGDQSADRVVVNGTDRDDKIHVSGDAGGVAVTGLAATVAILHPEAASDRVEINGLAGTNRIDVDGTNGNDTISLSGDASGVTVSGLPALVTIHHQDGANDELTIDGLDGDDQLLAAALADQPIALTLDGGRGNDIIGGSQGVETSRGGDGLDLVDGNRGNDVAFLGGGVDIFVWDPGDGSDTVEGQGGVDTMEFNGANIAETVELSANGKRLRFFRDIAGITMDTDGVEKIDFNALGGADLVTVNDLRGTDVTDVNVDLAGAAGGGDGQADRVVVNGSDRNDKVHVSGDAGGVTVTGLAASVAILHPEAASDRVEINGLAGTNRIDVDGTNGNDTISLSGDASGVTVSGLPALVTIHRQDGGWSP